MPDAVATTWSVGDTAEFTTVISGELIDRFADVSGDHNPLHMNDEYGRRTSFGGRIAHGMIAGALFSQLVGEHLPGEKALYRSQELRFLKPVHPGAEVVVRGEVISVDEGLSVLEVKTTLVDRRDEEIYVEGKAEVLVRPPEEREAKSDGSGPGVSAGWLTGQRVLISGASGGIGSAIATFLAHQGAEVGVGFRTREAAARLVCHEVRDQGGSATPVQLDACDPDTFVAALDDFGCPNSYVHCGFGEIVSRGVERSEYSDLTSAFDRAVGGFFHGVRTLLPGFRERGGGSIVAISSSVTREVPPPNWLAYTVAKSALLGMVRSLAVELGPDGVRVNAVSPTLTETEKNRALPVRVKEDLAARSPLGRLARPEDVANAVAFLVSPRSTYLTGVDLPVAGGAIL